MVDARTRSLDKVLDDMNKKFTKEGMFKDVITRGKSKPSDRIPCTPPVLSYLLQGGWVGGKLHELIGKEQSGKSTTILLALKDIFEFYNGERPIAYLDIEHRFNESWAVELGVPVDEMIIAQPTSAEQATDIMATLIENHDVCAIAFDSVGGAASLDELKTFEEKGVAMTGVAKTMTRNVKTIAPLANLYNSTVFYSNQMRDDISGYHQVVTPGGNAVKHMATVRLLIKKGRAESRHIIKDIMPDVNGKINAIPVGSPIIYKTLKNTWGLPERIAWSDFFFKPSELFDHVGFDVDADIQQLGLATEVIERNGAWYNMGEIKAQGREAFFDKLKEENAYDDMYKEIMERLGKVNRLQERLPVAEDNITLTDDDV